MALERSRGVEWSAHGTVVTQIVLFEGLLAIGSGVARDDHGRVVLGLAICVPIASGAVAVIEHAIRYTDDDRALFASLEPVFTRTGVRPKKLRVGERQPRAPR